MKKSTTLKLRPAITGLFLVIFLSTAFAVNKNELPGQKDRVKLGYSITPGKSVAYSSSTNILQIMDISGQTMNISANTDMSFKIKMLEKQDGNLKMEVTIDSLSVKAETPQGVMGSKIKDVEGKTFNVLISPVGKEIDISEAAGITYSVEGQGNNDLSQAFNSLFPDLPKDEIKPGDTWTKNDTIKLKTSSANTMSILQSQNKYEGIEQVNGIDCAKITSTVSGKIETTTQNMGMDIFFSGPAQGTATLYFAVKEGYFVKQESLNKINGTVEMTGPQTMSFPVIMETKAIIEAKK